LGFAAYFSRTEIVSFLLGSGADPNVASSNAFSVAPLHSAVAARNSEICRLLLEKGANPNVRQQKAVTPLHAAAHNGDALIVTLLLQYGADPAALTEDGKSAADFALEAGADDVLRLLC
jgi:uncharacterized protein